MTDEWIRPSLRSPEGRERFAGLDATVTDFWRFALSDLRMSNARGYLAEFLVAQAVGATGPRVEWDTYDVLAPDQTRIEVKSSGCLQLLAQRRLSRISFAGLGSQRWTRTSQGVCRLRRRTTRMSTCSHCRPRNPTMPTTRSK